MPGAGHRAPVDQAQDTPNQWHGRTLQRAHCRCPEDPPLQQRRRSGADAHALRGLVQPPTAPVSIAQQNTYAGHETVASNSP